MRLDYVLVLLLACLLLVGCSPSLESGASRMNAASLGTHLVHGQTTRQDVYRLLGPPQSMVRPTEASRSFFAPNAGRHPAFPDAEIWTYSGRSVAQAFPLDPRPVVHRHATLRIFFDQQGLLRDYSLLDVQH